MAGPAPAKKSAAKPGARKQAEKLYYFAWTGTDGRGKKLKGEIRAPNDGAVKAELRKQGINPAKVTKKFSLGGGGRGRVEAKDISIFARQLATMMSAGVPMVQSFDIVGKGSENAAMSDLILAIKADLESGTPLGDCLAKFPLYFDDLFCNLVRAGEAAGALENLLDKIATYKEKSESMKKKIKKALTYPIAVLVVAVAVTIILLLFVIPQFEDLFAGFGAELPAFTQMVVNMSRWMQVYWWVLLGSIGGTIYALIYTHKRSRKFREGMDRMMLHVPIVGIIVNKASVARFARTTATMFAAGVPMVEALESVAGAAGNIVYMNAILKMRDDISTGQSLQISMKQLNLFPSMVVQMIAIGEESGRIDTMLGKVADFYEEEVDALVDNLSSLMEPMIMSVLGVLVGGLVVAMYLPIFKMGQAV